MGWSSVGLAVALGAALLPGAALGATAAQIGGCAGTVPDRIVNADPGNYRALLPGLGPGDLMRLAPGTYLDGLPMSGHNGQPDDCIIVEGPHTWPPTAVFTVTDCCNTVSLRDSSYLVIRNLEIDGTGDTISADGVKAQVGGPDADDYAHHITLENLYIHDHDLSQQTVCISTKVPAWNWVVRRSVLELCGTGIYFGNSNGEDEFVNGLVEHNLITDSVGYNMQIKHQSGRDTSLGIPASGRTIVRHNVFSKGANSSGGGAARPNLLLGHWPPAGPGSDDDYLVYGNFFHRNPSGVEALFQAEGNVIVYDNVFVNSEGPGVSFQFNQGPPQRVRFVHNTVVARDGGVAVSGADTVGYEQKIVGNAVFAATPVGGGTTVAENVTGLEADAAGFLVNPFGAPGVDLDLVPLAGGLLQGPVDTTDLQSFPDWNRDFDSAPRVASFRGAYGAEGAHAGWPLTLERKPEATSVLLSINDQHPIPPVVSTPGSTRLTLDVRAGSSGTPLDWYYALVVAGTTYYVASDLSLTTVPTPLAVGVAPVDATGVVLLDAPLAPGTVATFAFALADGADLVAFDFNTVVVAP